MDRDRVDRVDRVDRDSFLFSFIYVGILIKSALTVAVFLVLFFIVFFAPLRHTAVIPSSCARARGCGIAASSSTRVRSCCQFFHGFSSSFS